MTAARLHTPPDVRGPATLPWLGEALGGLSKADPMTAGMFPDRRRIVGFRIILIHGYATIDEQAQRGELVDGDAVFDRLEREIDDQERLHGKT